MTKANRILLALLIVQILLVAGMAVGREEPKSQAPVELFADLTPANVTKIEIEGPKGVEKAETAKVVLEKKGTEWVAASAEGYPAKADKIEELLDKVKKLKSSGVVATKSTFFPKLEVADDKYQRFVKITEDGKERSFYLGSTPGFKKIHLRVSGENQAYAVAGITAWEVGTKATDWVDKNLVNFEEDDVWSVTITNDHGTVQLDKDVSSKQWALVGETEPTAKSVADDMIRRARSVPMTGIAGRGPKPEYGLDKPIATVSLVTGTSTIAGIGPKSTQTVTLKFGATVDDNVYASASNSDFVVKVAKWATSPLVNKGKKELLSKEEKKPAPNPAAMPPGMMPPGMMPPGMRPPGHP